MFPDAWTAPGEGSDPHQASVRATAPSAACIGRPRICGGGGAALPIRSYEAGGSPDRSLPKGEALAPRREGNREGPFCGPRG